MAIVEHETQIIEQLDFEPNTRCESSHAEDTRIGLNRPNGEHEAVWWEFKSCGCVMASCDQARQVHINAPVSLWKCGTCHMTFQFVRVEQISK